MLSPPCIKKVDLILKTDEENVMISFSYFASSEVSQSFYFFLNTKVSTHSCVLYFFMKKQK